MKSDTKTSIIVKTISVEEHHLVLTFTPEEVQALLNIGYTSKLDRLKMFDRVNIPPTQTKHNEACAKLLGGIYFAASDFTKENK